MVERIGEEPEKTTPRDRNAEVFIAITIVAILSFIVIMAVRSWENQPYQVRVICKEQCNESNAAESAEALFAYGCCYDACIESTEKVLAQDCALLETK